MASAKNDRHADDVAARQSTSIPAALYSELPNRPQARPRGGHRSRNKGTRNERALVRYLQEHGFAAERIPLSGSAGGRFVGDLSLPLLGRDRCVEVKCRGNGFRKLYDWLVARELLIGWADRRAMLACAVATARSLLGTDAHPARLSVLRRLGRPYLQAHAAAIPPCHTALQRAVAHDAPRWAARVFANNLRIACTEA
jgi:hypothetical protein